MTTPSEPRTLTVATTTAVTSEPEPAAAPVAPSTPATREERLARIVDVVRDTLKVDPGRITVESRFTVDLGADSLDRLTLLMEFEDKFSTSIPDDDARTLTSVGAVLDYIEARLPRA